MNNRSRLAGLVVTMCLASGALASLAGQYTTPLLVSPEDAGSGVSVNGGDTFSVDNPTVALELGDGSLIVSNEDIDTVYLLSADLETLHDTWTFPDVVGIGLHPDGGIIMLDRQFDTVTKHTVVANAFVAGPSYTNAAVCNGPRSLAIQQTGNQRIFVLCSLGTTRNLMQFDSDLSNEIATEISGSLAMAISPDDSFLVVLEGSGSTLSKYTINDAGGTLSFDTQITSLPLTSNTWDIVVRSDMSTLIADRDNDQIVIVPGDLSTHSTLSVLSNTIGGTAVTCDGPRSVAIDTTGTSDIAVACHDSAEVLVLSNSLTSAAMITGATLGVSPDLGLNVNGGDGPNIAVSSSKVYIGGDDFFAFMDGLGGGGGGGGDPVILDFLGHKFMAGSKAFGNFRMYKSKDEAMDIYFHTSGISGWEYGFFMDKVVVQTPCGKLSVSPHESGKMQSQVEADECMTNSYALGDNGLVIIPVDNTGTFLAVVPHQSQGFGFINLKFLDVTAAFRTNCATGLLCDETHSDLTNTIILSHKE